MTIEVEVEGPADNGYVPEGYLGLSVVTRADGSEWVRLRDTLGILLDSLMLPHEIYLAAVLKRSWLDERRQDDDRLWSMAAGKSHRYPPRSQRTVNWYPNIGKEGVLVGAAKVPFTLLPDAMYRCAINKGWMIAIDKLGMRRVVDLAPSAALAALLLRGTLIPETWARIVDIQTAQDMLSIHVHGGFDERYGSILIVGSDDLIRTMASTLNH